MAHHQIIEADWTWTGTRFERDVQVVVSPTGTIERVGAFSEKPTLRLAHQALLPGFINVHSHAFQRGLRGRGENFPQGAGSFWTWREAMYALVDSMTSDRLYELTCHAFSEMLACGITTVGEFHYVHHDASGKGFSLDDAILQAAHDVGIRLVLLQTYYRTGGVNQPLSGGQLRFACSSTDEYWKQFDRLAAQLRSDRQTMGAVAHSIRAASIDEIADLHSTARRRGLVFHMHVEEQQKEIDDCLAAYGQRPMGLFLDRLAIDENFTAIHCTHTAPDDLRRYLAAGGNVGLCPISEANLGDGIADVPTMHAHPGQVCIGTDANTRASMTDELRWVEYAQRLKYERRGVCRDGDGQVGRSLFELATANGARSLGLAAGAIEPRRHADFFILDLNAPSLAGWTPDTLLDTFIFGAADGVIAAACVAGRWSTHRPSADLPGSQRT